VICWFFFNFFWIAVIFQLKIRSNLVCWIWNGGQIGGKVTQSHSDLASLKPSPDGMRRPLLPRRPWRNRGKASCLAPWLARATGQANFLQAYHAKIFFPIDFALAQSLFPCLFCSHARGDRLRSPGRCRVTGALRPPLGRWWQETPVAGCEDPMWRPYRPHGCGLIKENVSGLNSRKAYFGGLKT
jgi:hypothetical protein